MNDTVPKAEYDALAARHARLVMAVRRCVAEPWSSSYWRERLTTLLRDEPETPKGDKLALARELAKAARVVVDNQYSPTAALIDALARFEASEEDEG